MTTFTTIIRRSKPTLTTRIVSNTPLLFFGGVIRFGFRVSGVLNVKNVPAGMAGVSSSGVSVSGTINAKGYIQGTSTVIFGHGATLRGKGALAGSASASFVAFGTINAPVSNSTFTYTFPFNLS